MKIRSINEGDIEELYELFANSGDYVSPRNLSDYWSYSRFFSSTCLCAEVEGEIRGAIIGMVDQATIDLEHRAVYIQDVAVSPDYRGKSIANLMMSKFIENVKTINAKVVWLTSEPENDIADKLWKKFNFVNLETDLQIGGKWISKNLKGKGRDRVVYTFDVG